MSEAAVSATVVETPANAASTGGSTATPASSNTAVANNNNNAAGMNNNNNDDLSPDNGSASGSVSGNEGPAKDELPKEVVASKVSGTVKWFNVKSGYGFINRSDTKEDVFVHQTAILKNNPKKAVRSVGDGELVEFDVVVGEKGNEAFNVSGPEGAPVKGSPYAADRKRGGFRRRGRGFFRGGGGRGGGRSGDEDEEDQGEGEEAHEGGDGGPRRPRRFPERIQRRRGNGKPGGHHEEAEEGVRSAKINSSWI